MPALTHLPDGEQPRPPATTSRRALMGFLQKHDIISHCCCAIASPVRCLCLVPTVCAVPAIAGERLSPWVSVACIAMGFSILFA
jgi:hypothetical protein